MEKQTIFIGSASESKPLARKVEKALSSGGYRTRTWWNEFPPGSVTLDRLARLAKEVDGAVFIFQGTEKAWYTSSHGTSGAKRRVKLAIPRDNVVLEYGLFAGYVGRERAVVFRGPKVKLPSDLNGVTYANLNPKTIGQQALEHFNREFANSPRGTLGHVPWLADSKVVEIQTGETFPTDWSERILYCGIEGARAWLAYLNDPRYRTKTHDPRIRQIQMEAIDGVKARTYVSFGPGDAETDLAIATGLRLRSPWLQYVPVDISDGLLNLAVSKLSSYVRIPVALLGDFEDGLPFLANQIAKYGSPPFFYSMFGGTFGNLDKYERSFVLELRDRMTDEDRFAFDVSTAQNADAGIQLRSDVTRFADAKRRFFSNGLARRTRESSDTILASFETRIACHIDNGSDVPGTTSVTTFDTQAGHRLGTVRYYRPENLSMWLESLGFTIHYKRWASNKDGVGYGVILVGK